LANVLPNDNKTRKKARVKEWDSINASLLSHVHSLAVVGIAKKRRPLTLIVGPWNYSEERTMSNEQAVQESKDVTVEILAPLVLSPEISVDIVRQAYPQTRVQTQLGLPCVPTSRASLGLVAQAAKNGSKLVVSPVALISG